MDNWDAGNAAFDRLGFDPTGVRSGAVGFGTTSSGRQGDPTGVDQWEKGYGGFDPLLDWGAQALDAQLAKDNAQNQWQGPSQWLSQSGTVMGGGNVGGDWAGVEQWSAVINQAAQKYGVPVNLIKAVMKLESNGDPNAVGAPGVWGPMQVHSGVWGYGPWSSDPVANIMKGAEILAGNYQLGNPNNPAEKSWEWAVRRYIGLGGPDQFGTDHNKYWQVISSNWSALNNASSSAGMGFSSGTWGDGMRGNNLVNEALKYQGVAYNWGSIPGKGDDPWTTGWDCSGFTFWLDQNYGNGQLPRGSHYQYDYAVRTGQLNRDASTLRTGDLIFFDTGSQAGGGAELNRASHVGVYIGNGQFIHAANPDTGTIVSSLDSYMNMYPYLGSLSMSWSGGPGYSGPTGGMASPQQGGGALSWNNAMTNFLTIPGYSWGR